MMPAGASRRIVASGTSKGWISQYTWSSRTRRAISCVYWEPKSRMRITAAPPSRALIETVVGRFLRDVDVVDVVLTEPRGGDADEGGPPQVRQRAGAEVAHARTQPPDELLYDEGEGALVRHPPLDALGHELRTEVDERLLVLAVAVAASLALAHRLERSHAAIELVGPALVEDRLARALLGAREEPADHDAVGAGGDRLRDVAGELDAAVGDHGNARPRCPSRRLADGRELRHAHAGHDARRAA